MEEKYKLIIAAVLGILLMLALWYGGNQFFNATSEPAPGATTTIVISPTISEDDIVVCTQEVKECPDGSFVGRQGPKCSFKPCPGSD